MQVKIQLLNKSLPLPKYHTKGSVGLDLYARVDTEIPAKSLGKIPANIIIETPPGFMFLISLRSSTPKKFGLIAPHGIGIVDQDYSGPEDEINILVYNFTDKNVRVKKGDRIAQGIFIPIEKVEWEEVKVVRKKSRGGFGSTDNPLLRHSGKRSASRIKSKN
ncbi:dUTP diphosphatase [Candidatus Daviesbacteria bacterium]|nr:dUTP diphosphatase [Candidatus Daviesbacteria bacterium]